MLHTSTQHNKWPYSVREVSICFIEFIEVELMNSKKKKKKQQKSHKKQQKERNKQKKNKTKLLS